MPPRGRPVLVLAIAGVVLSLSACNAQSAGLAGIGVDDQGRPVGYLKVCGHHLDGATLYSQDEDDLGTWQAESKVTDLGRWSLADPSDGWFALTPLADLQPRVPYVLYGWSKDNSWSGDPIGFTIEDLEDLEPGEVLSLAAAPSASGNEDVRTVLSEQAFGDAACGGGD